MRILNTSLFPSCVIFASLGVGISVSYAAAESHSADTPVRCEDVESIGVATMAKNGVITLQIRALNPDIIIESLLAYKPSDRNYQSILAHLGGLAPGQSKPVRPWC